MLDAETTIYGPGALDPHERRTVVALKPHGFELQLFFDDPGRQGPLREIRLLPGEEPLEPMPLRRLIPQAPLFLAYARSVMSEREGDWIGALEALRLEGRPGRGLSPEFFRLVARNYAALVAGGERHPVTALADLHGATISAASRWVTEARRRELIPLKTTPGRVTT